MNNPLVSIVILNWNGQEYIEKCINSVQLTSYSSYEIIVVDNASTDLSLSVIKKFEGKINLIVNDKNLGFAGGMNAGLRHAKGEYVVTLNNDVVVDPLWLNRPVVLLQTDEQIGIISCRQMIYGQEDIIDVLHTIQTPYLLSHPVGTDKRYSLNPEFHNEKVVFGASGASVIYRKQLLDTYGGFDERFFAYHEECDIQTRAFYDGWKCVYVPSAVVYHMGSKSFGKFSEKFHYYHERNRWWYIAKNYSLQKIIFHLPWLLLMELRLIRVIFFKSKCPGIYFKARIDAIKGILKYKFYKR